MLISCIWTDGSRSSTASRPNFNALCFVDDVLAALRDSIGADGQLTQQSLSVFGVCSLPGQPSGSVLLDLARKTGRKQELEILQPAGGTAVAEETRFGCVVSLITAFPFSAFVTEEVEMETIELTSDLPGSPLLKQSAAVLLLALDAPARGENVAVTFSSQSLQPDVQVTAALFTLFSQCLPPHRPLFPPSLCASRRRRATCF